MYTVLDPEFGEDQGKIGVIVCEIYGLKSGKAAFLKFFVEVLKYLGFRSCLPDVDNWRNPATKENRDKYYKYVLTYVHYFLVVSEDTEWVIKALIKDPYNYKLKDMGEPSKYLAAEIGKFTVGNKHPWYMSA